MQIPYDPLEFYAQILRNEIRSADAKVGIAVASSSILLSANFLMLRAGTLSPVPSAFVLLATATALAAVVFAILAVRPGVSSQSKGFFYYKNLHSRGPEVLLERFSDPQAVHAELALLCADYARIAKRKYEFVCISLNFLMASASATALTVVIRFLEQGSLGLR